MKKILLLLFVFFVLPFAVITANDSYPQNYYQHPLDNMPIFNDGESNYDPSKIGQSGPIGYRSAEYRKYLGPSVKIGILSGGSGSGTIVHYDDSSKLAYVLTCAHLFSSGTETLNYDKNSKKGECKIIVWYKNNVKLDKPETFTGSILYYTPYKMEGYGDTSLVVFKPDWVPQYFPIANLNYQFKDNELMNSCGCDSGSEVACYEVNFLGIKDKTTIVTKNNSPRPGRSGGGLFSLNGYYVGTCWGTTYPIGYGKGYFTSLEVIHHNLKKNGFEWILDDYLAKKLKVLDRNNIQGKYDNNYIPIPGRS